MRGGFVARISPKSGGQAWRRNKYHSRPPNNVVHPSPLTLLSL